MNDMQRPAIDLVYDDLLATIEERDAALARVLDLEAARDYWRDRAEAAEARAAELEAQLAALQHAACPHCGASLASEKLAPF